MDKGRALILTILQIANEKNILLSKTKLQKLVFPVQKELGREYFRFVPYKYGPWSEDLVREVERMVEEGIVEIEKIESSTFYRLKVQAQKDKDFVRYVEKYIVLPLEYLLALIYAEYPEMTELSEIKEKVKEFQRWYGLG